MAIRFRTASTVAHQASDWTAERIERLERNEIEQLKANALNLGEAQVAALCDAALAGRPKRRGGNARS